MAQWSVSTIQLGECPLLPTLQRNDWRHASKSSQLKIEDAKTSLGAIRWIQESLVKPKVLKHDLSSTNVTATYDFWMPKLIDPEARELDPLGIQKLSEVVQNTRKRFLKLSERSQRQILDHYAKRDNESERLYLWPSNSAIQSTGRIKSLNTRLALCLGLGFQSHRKSAVEKPANPAQEFYIHVFLNGLWCTSRLVSSESLVDGAMKNLQLFHGSPVEDALEQAWILEGDTLPRPTTTITGEDTRSPLHPAQRWSAINETLSVTVNQLSQVFPPLACLNRHVASIKDVPMPQYVKGLQNWTIGVIDVIVVEGRSAKARTRSQVLKPTNLTGNTRVITDTLKDAALFDRPSRNTEVAEPVDLIPPMTAHHFISSHSAPTQPPHNAAPGTLETVQQSTVSHKAKSYTIDSVKAGQPRASTSNELCQPDHTTYLSASVGPQTRNTSQYTQSDVVNCQSRLTDSTFEIGGPVKQRESNLRNTTSLQQKDAVAFGTMISGEKGSSGKNKKQQSNPSGSSTRSVEPSLASSNHVPAGFPPSNHNRSSKHSHMHVERSSILHVEKIQSINLRDQQCDSNPTTILGTGSVCIEAEETDRGSSENARDTLRDLSRTKSCQLLTSIRHAKGNFDQHHNREQVKRPPTQSVSTIAQFRRQDPRLRQFVEQNQNFDAAKARDQDDVYGGNNSSSVLREDGSCATRDRSSIPTQLQQSKSTPAEGAITAEIDQTSHKRKISQCSSDFDSEDAVSFSPAGSNKKVFKVIPHNEKPIPKSKGAKLRKPALKTILGGPQAQLVRPSIKRSTRKGNNRLFKHERDVGPTERDMLRWVRSQMQEKTRAGDQGHSTRASESDLHPLGIASDWPVTIEASDTEDESCAGADIGTDTESTVYSEPQAGVTAWSGGVDADSRVQDDSGSAWEAFAKQRREIDMAKNSMHKGCVITVSDDALRPCENDELCCDFVSSRIVCAVRYVLG